MAGDLPYYKMYPADAETDAKFRAMNDAEKGYYWRLLNHAWLNDGLAADQDELAREMGSSRSYHRKMWVRCGACFDIPLESGRVGNKRQEEERSKAKRRSESATNSVRTRYERSSDVALRALTRADSDSESDSGSEFPEGGVGETTGDCIPAAIPPSKLPRGFAFDEQYLAFRVACRDSGMDVIDEDFMGEAWREWCLLDGLQRAAAVEGIAARKAAGYDPRYIPKPKNYLKTREWKRPVRTAKEAVPISQRELPESRFFGRADAD